MTKYAMNQFKKLAVSKNPPYDPLQSFVRDNHIAIKGRETGKLAHYKFAAKDVFKIKGSTWGNGHPDWLRHSDPDEFTASAIDKLLDNGADLVGKTVCDELCYSISGENWHYGNPLNAADTRRLAGGSSSGSAVATAAGMVDFALGSDCLGSVRVPASYNGVIGLRPTYDRIANDGEVPYSESMDVLGYFASDAKVFQDVTATLMEKDSKEANFENLLIIEDAFEIVDVKVKEAFSKTIERMAPDFKNIKSVRIANEGLDYWVTEVFQVIQGYEVWDSYGGFINKYRPQLSPGPKERLAQASTITREAYLKAKEKQVEFSQRIDELLAHNSIFVLPTASSIAPLRTTSLEEIDRLRGQSSKLLIISALSGIPQLTLPLLTLDQSPLGVSLMSTKNTDRSLIDFGLKYLN